jgi:hypothetical protein
MGLKFYFNQKTWEAAAKQLRAVSWGIGGLVTAAGYQISNGWVLVASIFSWFFLQLCAFVLESIKHENDDERSKK